MEQNPEIRKDQPQTSPASNTPAVKTSDSALNVEGYFHFTRWFLVTVIFISLTYVEQDMNNITDLYICVSGLGIVLCNIGGRICRKLDQIHN